MVGWAILVMGIDVSHVWSTIFRTYADRETMAEHRFFLLLLPVLVWLGCFLLYNLGSQIFWRIMAYLAVYHFVRQQYGFMRIYSRNEQSSSFSILIDKIMIYAGALWPVLYWHFYGPRYFNWFIEGDFLYYPSRTLADFFTAAYLALFAIYLIKEIYLIVTQKKINFARNGIILGTCLSWYFAIVFFNSDRAFTLINVVSHGIPYIAIVFAFGLKKYRSGNNAFDRPILKTIFSRLGVALFIATLLTLAYAEESLWDLFVWQEVMHRPLFSALHDFFQTQKDDQWLLLFVPLLSVPQITHYIIDGFIWKIKKDKYRWTSITLPSNS